MTERWEYGDVAAVESDDRRFPWPPPDSAPVLAAFGETWKSATFDPASFFRRVPRDGGTKAALVYYMVLVIVVAGASLFWESLALFTGPFEETMETGTGLEAISPLVSFLLTPALLLVMLFLSAAITHGLMSLFNAGQHGFGTSIRVFCYAYSPGIFGIVPIVGGLIGSIWMVVLLIIGLREAHETEGWKAAIAVLLPFILLVGLLVFSFIMVMAAGAALLGGAG